MNPLLAPDTLFRAFFDTTADALGVSHNGRHVLVNPAYERLFGYAQQELMGLSILELIAPQERPAVEARVRRRAAGEEAELSYETRGQRRDGSTFDMEVTVSRYSEGTETYTLVILRDVSERHRNVQEMEEQRAFYKAIFDNYPLPKFLVDPATGRVGTPNAAALRFYGYSEQEWTGKPLSEINTAPVARIQEAIEGVNQGTQRRFRFQHRLASGEKRDVDIYSSPMEWDGKRLLLTTVLDVTDHLRLEEQLRQAQKMEAVGQLAGALAHDFNNMLTTIMGFASMAAEDLPPQVAARRNVEQVMKTAARAADLTRQLLAFSRRQLLQPQPLLLNHLLQDMGALIQQAVGSAVEVRWNLAPRLSAVRADPTQLQQVVVNLAVNARDAMPNGGILTLTTRDDPLCAQLDPPGPAVILEVADTGQGMDAATQARIFEPFFTTKPKGKGTGLGLASVYGIVTQSGGHVGVESQVGQGARFRVALPRTLDPLPQEREPTGNARLAYLTGLRVWVVEDEAPVRAFLVQGLTQLGCVVQQFPDGPSALASQEPPPDVVVSDVVMPHMSGPELVQEMRTRWPHLPAVLISGDAGAVPQNTPETTRLQVLGKPFTLHQLGVAVARLTAPQG